MIMMTIKMMMIMMIIAVTQYEKMNLQEELGPPDFAWK